MLGKKNKGTDEPVFKCEESQFPIPNTMELLGVTIDEKLNFEKHIVKICRKVSQQIAALKRHRSCCLLRLGFIKILFYHTLITVPKRGTSVIRSHLTS